MGEIKALLNIVDERNYVGELEATLKRVKETGTPEVFWFAVRRNYFNVFEKNINKIGLLEPPLPEKIVTFYTRAYSVLEDVKSAEEGNLVDYELSQIIEHLEELLRIFQNTVDVGKKVVAILEKKP